MDLNPYAGLVELLEQREILEEPRRERLPIVPSRHPFRDTPQWRQQRAALWGRLPDRSRTQRHRPQYDLAAEVERQAQRLRSGRSASELVAIARRRGRPTRLVRHARLELGWLTAAMLDRIDSPTLRELAKVLGYSSPSTVKKLADDFRALPPGAVRFVAKTLTPDASAYVDRVRAGYDASQQAKGEAVNETTAAVIRVEHYHVHEHRHVHEIRPTVEPTSIRDEELAKAIDEWEREESA